MKPALAEARSPRTLRSVGPIVAVAVVVGLALLALAMGPLSGLLEGPSFVDRIAFVNQSEYDIAVEVTSETRDGWLSVGTAQRRATSVRREIIDQGDVWIFRFAAQGETAGELRMTRAELEAAGWTVRLPDSVRDELRRKGAPPSP